MPVLPSHIPTQVWRRLEAAVGTRLTAAERFAGGMWGRTYRIRAGQRQWVARVVRAPEPKLRRIPAVQARAAATGLAVPAIVAHGIEVVDGDEWLWIVEEFVAGEHFVPAELPAAQRRALAADAGRQLRRLHTAEVAGFWGLSADATTGQHSTFRDWIEAQRPLLDAVVRLFPGAAGEVAQSRAVLDALGTAYAGPACLCHGDYADDNLLVRNDRLVAAIDWENAVACDPAHDVAYWYRWHGNQAWLDEFLAGYAPPAADAFRWRVFAHSVVLALEFAVWYCEEQEDEEGAAHSLWTLTQNLAILRGGTPP